VTSLHGFSPHYYSWRQFRRNQVTFISPWHLGETRRTRPSFCLSKLTNYHIGICICARLGSTLQLVSSCVTAITFLTLLLSHIMRLLLSISSFVTAVLATARTTPPSGSLTVGSSGKYSTVSHSCIFLESRTYQPSFKKLSTH
jgi:hypothetical protein